ncbi:MAG: HD-GYP domain-containing protein [Gammaproteobacteria bacterium]|nr:HD-GYP domain-containing protein [Gammaproteobacteria bacterium]
MLAAMATPESPYSSTRLLKLESRDLLLGMYIAELDCNWSTTPFPVGGFHLRKADDIQILQKFCKFVFIDTNQGVPPRALNKHQLTILNTARKAVPVPAALKIDRGAYAETKTIKQSIDKAYEIYLELQNCFHSITLAVKNGDSLKLTTLTKPMEAMIDCIIANPQTLIWLLNTDQSNARSSNYCVRAAIWATVLARQIGMNRNQISVLFLGTLLADIGMYLLPEKLINKRGAFRKKEFLAYRKHVEFGLELLAQHKDLDDRVITIMHCHHERHDGRGFPRRLRGEQIPALARFANLAYCYERLLGSNLPGGQCSPAKAMSKLYKQRVLKFPEQLVSEFIHLLGMYPVGTVLQLATKELAIVLLQNAVERLFPRVAVLTSADCTVLQEPKILDLVNDKQAQESRAIIGAPDVNRINVKPSDYTFRFAGKKMGLGPLSFRL